jgi:hypothetical protein
MVANIYHLCHVHLSAFISADHTGRIFMKFGIGAFMKICLQILNSIKIGQKYHACYLNTSLYFTVDGDNKSL